LFCQRKLERVFQALLDRRRRGAANHGIDALLRLPIAEPVDLRVLQADLERPSSESSFMVRTEIAFSSDRLKVTIFNFAL
jgi:hypothetical protein